MLAQILSILYQFGLSMNLLGKIFLFSSYLFALRIQAGVLKKNQDLQC